MKADRCMLPSRFELSSPFEPDSFIRRTFRLNNMDRESAIWQFTNMYLNPSSVRRMITTHKHAKGRWSRDDPSFLIIETLSLVAIAIFWYFLPFTPYRFAALFRSLLTFVAFDFYFVGICTTTILWVSLNRWRKGPVGPRRTDEDVEWRFCFDVYCNSFLAIMVDIDVGFLFIFVISYFSGSWFARIFLPNLLLLIGGIHFVVLAVPLILVVPFIKKFGIVPFITPMLFLFLLSLLFSYEGGKRWLSFHFSV
jgi:hypothetical protein